MKIYQKGAALSLAALCIFPFFSAAGQNEAQTKAYAGYTAFSNENGPDYISAGTSLYDRQWALKNDGHLRRQLSVPEGDISDGAGPGNTDTLTMEAVAGIDINVGSAWDYYTASSEKRPVIVAVIDTGIDFSHPDLKDAAWTNPGEIPGDGIDNDGNGYIDDINGWNFCSNSNQVYTGMTDIHGTHTAGTIAAAWDGQGITGIADSSYVKIMSLKALGNENGQGSPKAIKDAIRYARDNGASICNLSLGADVYDEELSSLISESNMLFVVSAGNGDDQELGIDIDRHPVYPAALKADNLITVGNLMFDGSLDESSNYGAESVDIAAPGTYILSTVPDYSYGFMSGTSMSAPMVTGAAALIYSCRPDLTLSDVRTAILNTARKLPSMEGRTVTGGMLDVSGAITWQKP